MNNQWTLNIDCNEVVETISQKLRERGLFVHRSFDLISAREMLREPEDCPCPDHGTAHCTCQYIVLLIGSFNDVPVSLVAHGHEGVTILSMERSDPNHADQDVVDDIRATVSSLLINIGQL